MPPDNSNRLQELSSQLSELTKGLAPAPSKLDELHSRLDLIRHEVGPSDQPLGPPQAPTEDAWTGFKKGLAQGAGDSLSALRRLTHLRTKAEQSLLDYAKPDMNHSPSYWPRTAGELVGTLPAVAPGAALMAVPGAEPLGGALLATTGAALSPQHPVAGAVSMLGPGLAGRIGAKTLTGKLAVRGTGAALGAGSTAAAGGDQRDVVLSGLLGGLIAHPRDTSTPAASTQTVKDLTPSEGETGPPSDQPTEVLKQVKGPRGKAPSPPGAPVPARGARAAQLASESIRSLPPGVGLSKPLIRFSNRLKALTAESTGKEPIPAEGTVPIPLGPKGTLPPEKPTLPPPVKAVPPQGASGLSDASLSSLVKATQKAKISKTPSSPIIGSGLTQKTLQSTDSALKKLGVRLQDESSVLGPDPTLHPDYPAMKSEVLRNGKNLVHLKRDHFDATGDPAFHSELANLGESYRGAGGTVKDIQKGSRSSVDTLRRRIPKEGPYSGLAQENDESLITHAVKYANQLRDVRHKAYQTVEKNLPTGEWAGSPEKYVFHFHHKPYDMGKIIRSCE